VRYQAALHSEPVDRNQTVRPLRRLITLHF
jgi:hypothetical protein